MTPGPGPRRRRRSRLLLTTAAALTALAGTVPTSGSAQAGTGRVLVVGPGANLGRAMNDLRPGDTLQLLPGTYQAGYVIPTTPASGTATAPILVTAADPTHEPLIQGYIRLTDANYWRLTYLRVQATIQGAPALTMAGGSNWIVHQDEFFGAKQTGALANVEITDSTGVPSHFSFDSNCVHDAGVAHLWMDHNLYVKFHGNSSSGGTIERNIIFNATDGAGIKLGDGGQLGAPGPWNVVVRYNTIVGSGTQIRMFGDVRNNTIYGNILGLSTMRFWSGGRTMAMTVENVVGTGNKVAHQYTFDVGTPLWDPQHRLYDYGDVGLHQSPNIGDAWTCTGWHPSYLKAIPYGRYGHGPWTTW